MSSKKVAFCPNLITSYVTFENDPVTFYNVPVTFKKNPVVTFKNDQFL